MHVTGCAISKLTVWHVLQLQQRSVSFQTVVSSHLSRQSSSPNPAPQVLFKLVLTLAATAAMSRGLVPQMIMYIKKNYSDELFQMSMVGYCMTCAWCCGKLGLSHELGAFLAGIMVGTMHQHEDVLHATEQVRFGGTCVADVRVTGACVPSNGGFRTGECSTDSTMTTLACMCCMTVRVLFLQTSASHLLGS